MEPTPPPHLRGDAATEPRSPRDRFVARIDAVSGAVGRGVPWLLLTIILVGAFNAIARKGGKALGADLSSNLAIELQWYCFSAVFLLGASVTLRNRGHVRVDVLSERLSPRARLIIERVGTWLLLIPFCVFVIWASWDPVVDSIRRAERSPDPGGLPRYILKPLVPLGFFLLLLQGIAEGIRRAPTATENDDPAREAHL